MSRSPRTPVSARLLAASLSAVLVAGALALAAPLSASAVVPPRPANHAQVVVKTGGERDAATNAVRPLEGVVLELRARTGGGGNGMSSTVLASCTSDLDGDCVFAIPNGDLDWDEDDNDFWLVQASSFEAGSPAAENYFRNPELVLSSDGTSFSTSAYRIAVDNLERGTTRTISAGGSGTATRSGIWQNSYANPPAQPQCGLDIALVSDLSYSVHLSGSLGSLKTAATGFVDALAGTPSTVSLYTFGTDAPAPGTAPLLDRSTLDADELDELRDEIDDYVIDGSSYTNWDAGFRQLFGQGYDQVVVITDGNPTRSGVPGVGNSAYTRLVELEQAVFSANTLKAEGTRVVAVGVGSSSNFATGQNLRAISGAASGSDYFISGWSQLADKLDELARENCEGTVTVQKKVVPWNTGELSEAQPASGWQFTTATTTHGTVSPGGAQTTKHNPGQGDHGTINYRLEDIPAGTTFSTSELQQDGYTLVRVDDKNAVCEADSAPLAVTNDGALGFSVAVGEDDIVTCTVYNKEPTPTASIVVDKKWVVNGQEYPDGQQLPESLTAQLTLGGTDQGWGVPRESLAAGSTIAIDEELGTGVPELCELTSQILTKPGDASVEADLDGGAYTTAALVPGLTSYLVTNTVECGSQLVLIKDVTNSHGGTATPADWKLGYTDGPTGGVASGTVNAVDPGSYTIEELGQPGSEGYAPRAQDPVVCDGDLTGSTVVVPIATRVTCTFYNEDVAPRLQLKKVVSGADLDPEEWTLTASEGGDAVLSGDGLAPYEELTAGVAYTLAETSDHPGADEFSGAWVCTVTDGPDAGENISLGGTPAAPTVSLSLGQDVECIVTNTFHAGEPEVLKEAVSATPNAGDGSWDVTYTITVTNPSSVEDLEYHLVDTPDLPTGVEGVSASYRVGSGSVIPVAWTGGAIQLTPTSATIEAGDAPVVYTVTLTLTVAPTAAEQAEACGTDDAGIAIDNLATLTPVGGSPLTSDDCAVVELPDVDYEKQVTSVRQLADGDWEIVYEVEVTATGPGVARYDLRDVPEFGDGIGILAANATATPAGQAVVADWNGGLGATPATLLADDRPITESGSHRYEITIVAGVGTGVIGTAAADCTLDEQTETGTGFLNRVWLTAGGAERDPREACASPAAPEFEKILVGSPVKNADGTVTLVYELIATNPSEVQLSYDLDDAIGFAVGVGILDAEITGAPAGVTLEVPAWNGVTSTRVATGVLLPSGVAGEHVYEITILAEPTLFVEEGDLACVPGTPGKGYFNGAVLFSGEDAYPDDACAPIPATDLPTLPLPPEDPELPTLSLTGVSMVGGLAAALILLAGGLAALWLRGRRPTGRHAA